VVPYYYRNYIKTLIIKNNIFILMLYNTKMIIHK
jgi:hypothetical protein